MTENSASDARPEGQTNAEYRQRIQDAVKKKRAEAKRVLLEARNASKANAQAVRARRMEFIQELRESRERRLQENGKKPAPSLLPAMHALAASARARDGELQRGTSQRLAELKRKLHALQESAADTSGAVSDMMEQVPGWSVDAQRQTHDWLNGFVPGFYDRLTQEIEHRLARSMDEVERLIKQSSHAWRDALIHMQNVPEDTARSEEWLAELSRLTEAVLGTFASSMETAIPNGGAAPQQAEAGHGNVAAKETEHPGQTGAADTPAVLGHDAGLREPAPVIEHGPLGADDRARQTQEDPETVEPARETPAALTPEPEPELEPQSEEQVQEAEVQLELSATPQPADVSHEDSGFESDEEVVTADASGPAPATQLEAYVKPRTESEAEVPPVTVSSDQQPASPPSHAASAEVQPEPEPEPGFLSAPASEIQPTQDVSLVPANESLAGSVPVTHALPPVESVVPHSAGPNVQSPVIEPVLPVGPAPVQPAMQVAPTAESINPPEPVTVVGPVSPEYAWGIPPEPTYVYPTPSNPPSPADPPVLPEPAIAPAPAQPLTPPASTPPVEPRASVNVSFPLQGGDSQAAADFGPVMTWPATPEVNSAEVPLAPSLPEPMPSGFTEEPSVLATSAESLAPKPEDESSLSHDSKSDLAPPVNNPNQTVAPVQVLDAGFDH